MNIPYRFPDQLSREEIINILNERKLHIPDAQSISLDDLRQIYKNFVMPLEMRQNNRKNYHLKNEEITQEYEEIIDFEIETQELPPLDCRYGGSIRGIETIAAVCVKRPSNCNVEEQLSSATKRIKINWN